MRYFTQTLLAALAVAAAGSALAQQPAAPAAAQTLSRAEVLADLEIWRQAGMDRFPSAEAWPDVALDADYQRHLAEYQRLRSGPAYAEAVQRQTSGAASSRL